MYSQNHHDPHRGYQQQPPPPPPSSSGAPPPPTQGPPPQGPPPQAHHATPPRQLSRPSAQTNGSYPDQVTGFSARSGGRIYELVVQQQPQRARMCGFGDKDRRPITPPPCVQLIVRDANTGQELDINEVETTYYVLTVDLWSADGAREVNLVRHSATSPSISTATSSSYPPPPPPVPSHSSMYPPHPQHQQHQQHPQHPQHPQHSPHPQHPHPQHQHPQHPQHPQHTQYPPYNAHGGHLHPPQTVPQQQQNGYPAGGYYSHGHQPHSSQHPRNDSLALPHSAPPAPPAPSGMFSRNLIGSLSASAFKLYDTDNKMGVWFVLQDLSVRTEGAFRLKMNFVNVGKPDGQGLSTGITPVLATAYSDVFHVYAAKKFPGVVPGTLLSKKFAAQGIKIPVRREKENPTGDDEADA